MTDPRIALADKLDDAEIRFRKRGMSATSEATDDECKMIISALRAIQPGELERKNGEAKNRHKEPTDATAASATELGGKAVIENGAVVIRFPFDAMQSALDGAWGMNVFDKRQKITHIEEFAKEFCSELNSEDERGTTLVHRMADKAFVGMMEQGAFGFEDHEVQSL